MHAARHYDDEVLMIHKDDLARALTIGGPRLLQMAREGKLPRAENGWWDLYAVLPPLVEYLRSSGQLDKARLAKAKADQAEMKAAEMAGTVVPIELVERQWTEAAARFKQKMFSIPNRVAPLLALEENTEVIAEHIRQAIEQAAIELSETELKEDFVEQDDGFSLSGSSGSELERGGTGTEIESEEFSDFLESDEEEEDDSSDSGLSSEFDEFNEESPPNHPPAAKNDGQRVGRR